MDVLNGEFNVEDLVAPPPGGLDEALADDSGAKFWTEFFAGVSSGSGST